MTIQSGWVILETIMELNKALDHISEIHRHLSKTEVYRGIGSLPVAISGLSAFAGGLLQSQWVEAGDSYGFVVYWGLVALINLGLATGVIFYNYFYRESSLDKKRTRRTLGQFLPSVLAGLLITISLIYSKPDFLVYLPGIWCILFGLGVFSARPYLPGLFIVVGLFFFIAGAVLLALSGIGESLTPYGMSLSFGPGLILSSGLLYWCNERGDHG